MSTLSIPIIAQPISLIERIECKRCKAPLGKESRDSGYHFCHKCRICTVCNNSVSPSESASALTDSETIHVRCMARPPFHSENNEVTPEQLEYLNMYRLMMVPDIALSEQSNSQIACNTFNQWVTRVEPTADVMVLFLTKLESVLAECHRVMATSKIKGKIQITARDAKKYKEALDERAAPTTPKLHNKEVKKSSNKLEHAKSLLAELNETGVGAQTVDETNDFMASIMAKAKAKLESK